MVTTCLLTRSDFLFKPAGHKMAVRFFDLRLQVPVQLSNTVKAPIKGTPSGSRKSVNLQLELAAYNSHKQSALLYQSLVLIKKLALAGLESGPVRLNGECLHLPQAVQVCLTSLF